MKNLKRKLFYYKGKKRYKEQIAHLKGYYIDKEGEIYFKKTKRIPSINVKGYKTICIKINGEKTNLKYHRLQAYQKYGDKIYKRGIHVRHLDNNPSNNSFNNIAIGTASQNYNDSREIMRELVAQKGGDALRKYDHTNIIALHNQGLSYSQITNITGLKKGMISWIINHSTASKT